MSGSIEVGAVEFLSVKDAAARVSYSRDYVARLAREGKIVATQIGRQWFVDPVSLDNFASVSELERAVRGKQLRDERRQERAAFEEQTEYLASLDVRVESSVPQASLKTLCVLVCGLLVGVLIHAATSSEYGSLQGLNIAAQVSYVPTAHRSGAVSTSEATERTVVDHGAEMFVEALPAGHGILLLPEVASTTELVAIDELFSDEVTVTYESEQSGYITPSYRSGTGTRVPFVSVPVHTKSAASAHNNIYD